MSESIPTQDMPTENHEAENFELPADNNAELEMFQIPESVQTLGGAAVNSLGADSESRVHIGSEGDPMSRTRYSYKKVETQAPAELDSEEQQKAA